MSRRYVEFSKQIAVVVDAETDVDALRTALATEGLKQAFDDAQTLFSVVNVPDTEPLGLVVAEKWPEVI